MKIRNLKKTKHCINLRKFTKLTALCISALFIISILSAISLAPVQAATSAFGNSAIGTYRDQNDANAQSVSYFKATTTGSITDIIAYISGASSGKATAALYAVNGNTPGALLAQSSSVNIGTAFSWIDFQLSTTYSVTAGTTYGLAILGNIPLNIAIVSGTGQRSGGPGYGSFAKGFTNPFGTVWFNDVAGAMSIYATGTSLSTPTSAPIPTPTPTTTPIPTSTPITTQTLSSPIAGPNLASMPNGWTESITVQRGIGDPTFGSKIIYPVTQGGQTCMKLLAYSTYPYTGTYGICDREIDSAYRSIHPGDTIVFSAWLWTEASSIGDQSSKQGIGIALDAYGSGGRINQINNKNGIGTPDYSNGVFDYDMGYLPWGSGGWVHFSMTWTVPSTLQTDSASNYSNSAGYTVVPCGIIPEICGGSASPGQERAAAYIYGTELYITT
jgi:hypothetical protein